MSSICWGPRMPWLRWMFNFIWHVQNSNEHRIPPFGMSPPTEFCKWFTSMHWKYLASCGECMNGDLYKIFFHHSSGIFRMKQTRSAHFICCLHTKLPEWQIRWTSQIIREQPLHERDTCRTGDPAQVFFYDDSRAPR